MWYNVVGTPNAGGKTDEQLAEGGQSWVDVRDIANAHVHALEKEEAGGNRFIITAGNTLRLSKSIFLPLTRSN
jgi:nucleoside-diphosphate-sugar epimerase